MFNVLDDAVSDPNEIKDQQKKAEAEASILSQKQMAFESWLGHSRTQDIVATMSARIMELDTYVDGLCMSAAPESALALRNCCIERRVVKHILKTLTLSPVEAEKLKARTVPMSPNPNT